MADDTIAKALKTALNVSAVTSLLAAPLPGCSSSIWRGEAKQGQARPFLVIRGPIGRPTEYTLKVKVSDAAYWQFDAYADDSATADAIIAQVERTLTDNPLPVEGKTTMYCRKFTDLPAPDEFDGQTTVKRSSQQYLVEVSA